MRTVVEVAVHMGISPADLYTLDPDTLATLIDVIHANAKG